jgi:hypothetical protein
MRAVRILVGVVALMSLAVGPAAAVGAPVVIGPIHEEGEAPLLDCGDFMVVDQYSIDFTLRLFFDADGNRVRGVEHVSGTDTFTNAETGKALPGRFANNVLIDFESGLGANAGIIFRLNVPGYGVVFHEVGRVISDRTGTIVTFEAGPKDFTNGEIEGLCAALA